MHIKDKRHSKRKEESYLKQNAIKPSRYCKCNAHIALYRNEKNWNKTRFEHQSFCE